MPTTKSSKKRLRQSFVRRDRNRTVRSSVRSQVRKVREAIESGDVSQSQAQFRLAVKNLDRAAAKHVIHRNAAARVKSRLSAKIKALTQGAAGA